jgi:predicted ester cyclase
MGVHVPDDPHDLATWYGRYNEICNGHRFEMLSDFVHPDVHVNGERQGLTDYIAGLKEVVDAFPDYRWELQRLLIEGDWLAAHFMDSGQHSGLFLGVPASGRRVVTQEFAFYRVASGLIVEVWVTADNLRLLEQMR